MSIDGTTPEGFKKSFKGCGIVAAGLMALLIIVMIIMLFVMKAGDDGRPDANMPPAETTLPQ